jgi:ABC-type cobalamin/Fe3+-siderophores transport system ATPase subunit/predicted transcriptional regulator
LDQEWITRPPLATEAQKKLFAEQYVEAAIGAQLSVVAITDHNLCRHRDELLIPYLQEVAIPLGLTVLPGFEVTVSDCGGTHILAIFSEGSSLTTIDEVVSQLFPPGNPRFRGDEVLPSARGIEDLDRILRQSGLDHLLVFAHADRENGVLYQRGGAMRARLWKQPFVRIAQLSKPPSECTGFVESVVKCTNSSYSREIAYVIASDCRSLDPAAVSPERCALGSRYTWIKADPTFEGLRQIVFEPNDRTRFQEHKPEEKPAFITIDQVRFLDPSGTFQSDPIQLNPNLVTIIGGKSTGKSILLSCIARAIDVEQAQAAAEIARANLYDLGALDFEVVWNTGDVDRLSETEVRHRVTFLPQMFIHRLVEQENRPSLSESLLRFLRQNESFEALYGELIGERDAVMIELATETSNFFSFLSSWRDVVTKTKELGDRSSIESELNKIEEKSEGLRKASGFSEKETEQYQKLQLNAVAADARYKTSQRVEACMQDIASEIPPVIQDAIAKLDDTVAQAVDSHGLEETERQQVVTHVKRLKQAIRAASTAFTSETSRTARELANNTRTAATALEEAKSAVKPYLDKIANQKELKELQESHKQLSSLLQGIRQREKEKSQIEQKYWASVTEIERLVAARFGVQERLIELFNDPAYARVGEDIVVTAELTFDKDGFESDFLGCFNLRHPVSRLGDHYEENRVIWSRETHVEIITSTLKKVIGTPEAQLKLRAGQTLRNAVEVLLRDYLSHSFSVKQAGEDIFRMSPGKQGLVLLEIFLHLSNSTYPILIDQPEDNLDNRTIYSHLVRYIRTRKLSRQIIMVTHNPNLVLGTDAEQVIVANQGVGGQGENARHRFEYVSGAIECSFTDAEVTTVLESRGIREHVCHVLEGGEEAFRKREEKYCLSR